MSRIIQGAPDTLKCVGPSWWPFCCNKDLGRAPSICIYNKLCVSVDIFRAIEEPPDTFQEVSCHSWKERVQIFSFFFPNKTKPDDRNVQNCNSLAIFSKFHCRFSTSVLTVFVNDRTISASLNILFHAEHKDLVTPKILKVL